MPPPLLALMVWFQFTHPGKGATCLLTYGAPSIYRFNSRTLGRVRLDTVNPMDNGLPVSIHAPWEGCDWPVVRLLLLLIRFQFTHPGKGATTSSARSSRHQISFNSRTLGRVRPEVSSAEKERILFQFTHPGKGATLRPRLSYWR